MQALWRGTSVLSIHITCGFRNRIHCHGTSVNWRVVECPADSELIIPGMARDRLGLCPKFLTWGLRRRPEIRVPRSRVICWFFALLLR